MSPTRTREQEKKRTKDKKRTKEQEKKRTKDTNRRKEKKREKQRKTGRTKHKNRTRKQDTVAEWLRRWIANPLLFERESSNLSGVDFYTFS